MDYTDSSNSRVEDTSLKNDEDVKLFDVVRDVRDLSTPDSPDQSHQALEQCTSSNIGECQDLLQAVAVSSHCLSIDLDGKKLAIYNSHFQTF